jgi:Capsule polysaccharide biosynthesis protein
LCKGEYRYLFPQLARVLREEHEVEPWAVVFNTPTERLLNLRGGFAGVFNLAAHIRRGTTRLDVDTALEILREFESTAGFPNANLLLFGDRIISEYSFERGLKVLATLPEFWRSVIASVQPDLILGEISSAAEWMGWCYATQQGIRQIIPYPPPMSGRLYFIDAPEGDWREMAEHYESRKRLPLTREESSEAEKFLVTYRDRRPKPAYISWDEHSPIYAFHPQRLLPRVARIPFRFRTWLEDGFSEVGSYHGTPPWQPIFGTMAAIGRHIRARRTMFSQSLYRGPKIYYSLHAQPEFTVDVRAPFYRNQLALIENLAKSLPIGYRLIVKDHPSMKGDRPLEFYRQLKRLPNVQLVSPSIDSHELIAQCDLVITINGSVAWEAILYEKPVIVFGALCYGFFEKVIRCENPADLPNLLKHTLRQFRPDRAMLLRFITAYLETVKECEWGAPTRIPSVTSPANISRIAEVIAGEIPGSHHERTAHA